jgi:hypothetical protein
MDAAEVVANVNHGSEIQPTSERQVRPLVGLEPEQQREAWRIASEATANPTAAFVAQVAATIERLRMRSEMWVRRLIRYE